MPKRTMLIALVLLAAAACATVPTGPSVPVMPSPDKPFDLFQAEDLACRQWADQQIGASPQDTINKNTGAGALIGGAVGAGLGSLSGYGSDTTFGAIVGALIGSSIGSDSGHYYGYQAQRTYDIAYQQCMYTKGNMVPGVRYRRSTPLPPPPDLRSQEPDSAPDNAYSAPPPAP